MNCQNPFDKVCLTSFFSHSIVFLAKPSSLKFEDAWVDKLSISTIGETRLEFGSPSFEEPIDILN
jgi:hypothetical protein